MAYIAVVGAANVDIGGFVNGRVLAEDSNPGRVRLSMGGVGRNIACNAARMGARVELVTALGGDAYSDMIRADCARAGVGLAHAMCFAEEATSTYLFIAGSDGDMNVAVNDMGILDRMTVESMRSVPEMLNRADVAVLEANLPAETIAFLAENLTVPVIADAVSAAKVMKLKDALSRLDAFKPNRIEAQLLTGVEVNDEASARKACEAMLEMGMKRVFLTMGTRGVCCADGQETLFLPCAPVPMKNATGAGDAFTAALAWARAQNMDLRRSALAGMAAASIAVETVETVSNEMSETLLLRRMAEIDQGGN